EVDEHRLCFSGAPCPVKQQLIDWARENEALGARLGDPFGICGALGVTLARLPCESLKHPDPVTLRFPGRVSCGALGVTLARLPCESLKHPDPVTLRFPGRVS